MLQRTKNLVVCVVLTSTAMWGQAVSGEITGVVTDTTNELVPGARLTATNVK